MPGSNAFWLFSERLAATGAVAGYACGGPGEPCDPGNRPYFRWGAPATRGQISKITATAAGLPDPVLYPGSFSDWARAGLPVASGPEPGARPSTVARSVRPRAPESA